MFVGCHQFLSPCQRVPGGGVSFPFAGTWPKMCLVLWLLVSLGLQQLWGGNSENEPDVVQWLTPALGSRRNASPVSSKESTTQVHFANWARRPGTGPLVLKTGAEVISTVLWALRIRCWAKAAMSSSLTSLRILLFFFFLLVFWTVVFLVILMMMIF